MDAFHCPTCGAPQPAKGPEACVFCGAALNRAERATATARADLGCPGCGGDLEGWSLDPRIAASTEIGYRGTQARVHGCRGCGGVWVGRATLDAMIHEAASGAPTTVRATELPRRQTSLATKVVYRRCPRCRELMSRRNFARVSGVVVDECPPCGTYFDAGELEDVVAFVRAGGLAYAETKRRPKTPVSTPLGQPSTRSRPERARA